MTARVVRLRPPPAPEPTALQLADRLLQWHADLHIELDRNDQSAEDFGRRADAQLEAARRSAEEALGWVRREPETYLALMGISARYFLSARVYRARARELR